MIATFRALSALLSYPSQALKDAAPDLGAALADEGLLSRAALADLSPLLDDMARRDLFALQESYVFLFDRSRSLCLNLFEHIHGESRDRGAAMVDLLETYRAGGLELDGPELPDHLPVLLEFLSTQPLAEGRAILADAAHILAALADRLARRDSPYAAALRALTELAAAAPDAEAVAALTAIPMDDPADLAALDATYAEAAVTFGPDPNAGCPATRDMLNRMAVPTQDAAPVPCAAH